MKTFKTGEIMTEINDIKTKTGAGDPLVMIDVFVGELCV